MDDGFFGGIVLVVGIATLYWYYFVRTDSEPTKGPTKKYEGLPPCVLLPQLGKRVLWGSLPQVVSCGILDDLSEKQKLCQEALFEILTSEISYLKSLNILLSQFCESSELNALINEDERKVLYGNVLEVKECSASFLKQLLLKWEKSLYVEEIGDLINEFAIKDFTVYKEYCRNQPNQERTYLQIRSFNKELVDTIKSIEDDPKCNRLTLDSYLMAPMQRVTRLPLLVDAVIKRTESYEEKLSCENALESLKKLLHDCNEAARETLDGKEAVNIITKLDISAALLQEQVLGKYLLKGEFLNYPLDHNGTGRVNISQINWTFRKAKLKVYLLILFTNQIFVIKKKSSGKLELIRAGTTANANLSIKKVGSISGISKEFQHYFVLNFSREKIYYVLGAKTEAEVASWCLKVGANTNDSQAFDDLNFTIPSLDTVSHKKDKNIFKRNSSEAYGSLAVVS